MVGSTHFGDLPGTDNYSTGKMSTPAINSNYVFGGDRVGLGENSSQFFSFVSLITFE